MSGIRFAGIAALVMIFLAGCASSSLKQRRDQREKAVQTAKLYCEFLNGEQYPDIDVAVNLAMASKCDSEKSFSITNYKTPSEISGIMYCCSVTPKAAGVKETKAAPRAEAKAEPREIKPEFKSDTRPEVKEVKADLKPATSQAAPAASPTPAAKPATEGTAKDPDLDE